MSSKFNNTKALQKPPKICAVGPEGWRWFDYVFLVYPLQAYVSWHDPFSPFDHSIAGTTILEPAPPSNLHFGAVTGGDYSVEVDLIYIPATEQFSLILQLLLSGSVIDDRSHFWTEPLPVLPWSFGLFTWHNPPSPVRVQCKINT